MPTEDSHKMTIDLTDAAVKEIERLKYLTGLSRADLFRSAFTLLRIHVNAAHEDVPIYRGSDQKIELPFSVERKPDAD